MKLKLKFFAFIGLAAALSMLWVGIAEAANFKSGNAVGVAKDEVVESSVYMAGSTITIAGTVRGDVFCAGQTVVVSGTVEGDVLCAAQTIRVSGTVSGDTRLAGQVVEVTGRVDGSATAAGQSVAIEDAAAVGRDLSVFGSSVRVGGSAARDVTGAAETFVLAGVVGRNANVFAERVEVTEAARVSGNITYTSQQEATIQQGAIVQGKTERKEPTEKHDRQPDDWTARVMSALYWFGALLLLGLIALFATPKLFNGVSGAVRAQPWWTLGAGLVGLIVTPVVAIILFMTLLGIPLAVILLALWMSAILASFVFSGHALGALIMQRAEGVPPQLFDVIALALGLLVLLLVSLLPLIGGLAMMFALVWGLGGLLIVVGQTLRVSGSKKRK